MPSVIVRHIQKKVKCFKGKIGKLLRLDFNWKRKKAGRQGSERESVACGDDRRWN